MATTPKSRPKSSKPASRTRSATNSRPRPATAKAAPPPPAPSGTASKLRAPVIAGGVALAGIAGGIVLGARARPRRRRLPSVNGLDVSKLDMKKTAKQVGRASKQFGELTRELRKAGEQAERIGDALT
jgi:hypothetical protein